MKQCKHCRIGSLEKMVTTLPIETHSGKSLTLPDITVWSCDYCFEYHVAEESRDAVEEAKNE
jgi:hypothetical protein